MSRLTHCHVLEDFRLAAQCSLPRGLFEFIDRGSEREVALAENVEGFRRLKLLSRVCVDFSTRSMATKLFGKPMAFPLAIAPTGVAGLCWFQGELALAQAAKAMGVPFTLTSTSITPMERIAAEVGGRLWFQLYIWKQEELSFGLIRRARDLGYEALVVTADWALGRTREYNDRSGFTDPISLNRRFVTDMAFHPRWLFGVMGRYATSTGLPRHENFPPQYRHRITRPGNQRPQNSEALSWSHIARIRDIWPGPLILKGILSADDAGRAAEEGVDAIVISNHGGRALDSAVATIDLLPEIVVAVGGRADVLLDGGIRYGSDIVKALALGAKAVLVGRPALYGVAAGGQAGAEKVLRLLSSQFEKNMGYVGARSVSELSPAIFTTSRAADGRHHTGAHERVA
jgi:(S)-mandelate dehydrogenase